MRNLHFGYIYFGKSLTLLYVFTFEVALLPLATLTYLYIDVHIITQFKTWHKAKEGCGYFENTPTSANV